MDTIQDKTTGTSSPATDEAAPLSKNHMEIERKWLVNGWPRDGIAALEANMTDDAGSAKDANMAGDTDGLPLIKEEIMRQGYISVDPTVRIREEKVTLSNDPDIHAGDNFILCFKSHGTLSRREIEFPISKEHFDELEELIGYPLIPKVRRTYRLPDGLFLEVNHVDEGAPTEFWYAEIEFPSEEAARTFDPSQAGLDTFLNHDVTQEPSQTMGAYWSRTRLGK